jgi:uncharacterized membrane protein
LGAKQSKAGSPGLRRRLCLLALTAAALAGATGGAHAALAVCNRTSYVLDAAIGLEDGGVAAAQGWFRVDPGDCTTVMAGDPPAGRLLLHARALPFYAAGGLTPDHGERLCVEDSNFIRSDAGGPCLGKDLHRVPFAEVKPRPAGSGWEVDLTDADGFDRASAAMAGVQRLLAIAGYDALPIDGKAGGKTTTALARFDADHPGTVTDGAGLWQALTRAAAAGPGIGLVWCNDTADAVLAAWGATAAGKVTTRGWYRIATDRCVSATTAPLSPGTVYSYGTAVVADKSPVHGKARTWGGSTVLCTREDAFQIDDQKDCAGRGLDATGFAALDPAGKAGVTVHFR